jgi:hypothetical protein
LPHTSEASPKNKLSVALGLAIAVAMLILAPSQALAAGSGGIGPASGPPSGTTTPGATAKLVDGYAIPPASAPDEVVAAIEAANRIVDKPYCMGGGHQRWESRCYDCSGTVSYALGKKGAGVLKAPMPSGSFMNWEERGIGDWITVYANGGHMYAVIAGLRLDTSQTAGNGPGWSKVKLHQSGFSVRHPAGF